MKCPRCSAVFSGAPDEHGFYNCPQCAAKLRARSPATAPAAPAARPSSPQPAPASAPPDPTATLPPSRLKPIPRPGDVPATLEMVLAEIRAVRKMQEELMDRLGSPAGAFEATPAVPGLGAFDDEPPALSPQPRPSPGSPIRARRRKTVLLVDDDDQTRSAALAALEAAQVPTRAVKDAAAGLEGIASEKPDVIVLELDVAGPMAGKDAINLIKATMEWVDIPIVLYTRLPIESQREARTVHGADELVPKSPGSAEVLVQRVIQVFRRG